MRRALAWASVAGVVLVPLALAAMSPLLAWRDPIYIAAGFAGIAGFGILFLQPLLAAGLLPGLSPHRARQWHRVSAGLLIGAVVLHVGGLWVTSPPDVVDALLFASPTPFSLWGVIAMWAIFATALLAMARRRLPLSPRTWRQAHAALALLIVAGTILHALLIDGTMEPISKIALCLLVALATLKALAALRIWRIARRTRR